MKPATIERKSFAEILIREGIVSSEIVLHAREIQKRTGEPIEEVLIEEGNLTEWDIARVLVKLHRLPFVQLSKVSIAKEVMDLLPVDFLREKSAVPMDRFGQVITVAVSRNGDSNLISEIRQITGLEPYLFVTTMTEVKNALNLHFPTPFSEFDGLLTDVKKNMKKVGKEWDLDGKG